MTIAPERAPEIETVDVPVHTPGPIEQGLIDALALLDEGSNWTTGTLVEYDEKNQQRWFCSVGAVARVHDLDLERIEDQWSQFDWEESVPEVGYLAKFIPDEADLRNSSAHQKVAYFNDHLTRNFAGIREMFEKAILEARKDGV